MSTFLHVKFGSGRPPEHAHQLPFAHEIEEDPSRTALHESLKTDVQRNGVIRYLEQNFKEGSYVHDVVSSRDSEHGMYALVCKNWARSVGDPKLHLSLYIYQDDRHVATWVSPPSLFPSNCHADAYFQHAYTDRSVSYSRSGDENDPPPEGAGADPYSTAEALEAAASRAPTPAPASPDGDRPRFNRPAAAPDSDEDGVEPPFETNGLSSKPGSPTSIAKRADTRSPGAPDEAAGHKQDGDERSGEASIRQSAPAAEHPKNDEVKREAETTRSSRSSRRQRRHSTSSVDELEDDTAYPIVKSKPIGRTLSRRSPTLSPPPPPRRGARPQSDRDKKEEEQERKGDSSGDDAAPAGRDQKDRRRQRSQRRRQLSPEQPSRSPSPRQTSRSPSPSRRQPPTRPAEGGRRAARSTSPSAPEASRSPSPVIASRAPTEGRSSRRRRSPSPEVTEPEPRSTTRGRESARPTPTPVPSAPAPFERTPSWRSVSRNRHRRDDSDEDTLVRGNLDDHELDIPAGGETTLLEAKRRSASKDRSARRTRPEPKDEGFDPKEVEKPPVPPPRTTAKAVLGGWLKSVGTLLKMEGELAAGEVEQKVLEHEVDEEKARAQRKEERRMRREARAARRAARAKQEEAEVPKLRAAGRAAAGASDTEIRAEERKEEKGAERRRDKDRDRGRERAPAVEHGENDRAARRPKGGADNDAKVDARRARDVSPDPPRVDARHERSSRHRHHGSSNVESPFEVDDEEGFAAPSRRGRAMSVSATFDKGMQHLRKSVADIVSNVSTPREEAKSSRSEKEERRRRQEAEDEEGVHECRRRRDRLQEEEPTTRQAIAPRRQESLSEDEPDIPSTRSTRRRDDRSHPRRPARTDSTSHLEDVRAPSRSNHSHSRRRPPRPPSPSESSAAETVSTRRRDESADSIGSRRERSPEAGVRRPVIVNESEEEALPQARSKPTVTGAFACLHFLRSLADIDMFYWTGNHPDSPDVPRRVRPSAYGRADSPPRSPVAQRDQRFLQNIEHAPRRIARDAEHLTGRAFDYAREKVGEVEEKLRRVEHRGERQRQERFEEPYVRDGPASRRPSPLTTTATKHDSALPPIVSPNSPIRLPRSHGPHEGPLRPQPVRPASYRTTVSRPTSSYKPNESEEDESSDANHPAGRRRAHSASSSDEDDCSRRSRPSAVRPSLPASEGTSSYRFPPPASAPSSAAFSDRSFPRSDLESEFDNSEPDSRHPYQDRNVRSAAPSPSLSTEPEPVTQRGRNISFTRSKGESYDPFGSSSEESEDSEVEDEREREQERRSRTTVGGAAPSAAQRWDRRGDTYDDEDLQEQADGRRPFSRTTVGQALAPRLAGSASNPSRSSGRPPTFSPTTSSSRSPYSSSYNSRFAPPSHSTRYSPSFQDDDPRFSPSQKHSPSSSPPPEPKQRTKVGVNGSAQTFGRFGAPVSRRAARRLGL